MQIRNDIPPSLLLVAPHTPWNPFVRNMPSPHLGLWRIAGFLSHHRPDIQVSIFDPWCCDEDLHTLLARSQWTVIGISTLNDSLANDLNNINLAKTLNPSALVLAGGIEATTNYQTILDHSKADGVILGWGEKPLLKILSGDPLPVPGLIVRQFAEEITNDDFDGYWKVFPLEHIPYRRYWAEVKQIRHEPNFHAALRIVDVSHCNRRCAFCSITRFSAISMGKTSTPILTACSSTIVSFIKRALQAYPEIQFVYSVSDDFLYNWDRAVAIFEEISNDPQTAHLKWMVQSSIPQITRQRLEILARYHVIHLTLGLESFIPRILHAIHKIQNPEKIFDIVRWCKAVNILPYILIILFYPIMNLDELKITYRQLVRLQEMGAGISIEPFLRPYPMTPISIEYDGERQSQIYTDYLGNPYRIDRTLIPNDPDVKKIFYTFQEKYEQFLNSASGHLFKGNTSQDIINILGQCLKEYNA
jgi:radical SAM superfamily enzyme YgiQ (UPF0313 family)